MRGKSIIALTTPLNVMPLKPKPPAHPLPTAHKPSRETAAKAQNLLPQADSRWQRTVRYGWDKGGARGGRK